MNPPRVDDPKPDEAGPTRGSTSPAPAQATAPQAKARPPVRHARKAAGGTPTNDELAHELQVHQTELEMQNEELRRAQIELAAARDRFIDLYDFAPVGYLTLDRLGRIVEANLKSAAELDTPRTTLIGRRLADLVATSDGDRWHRHLIKSLQGDDPTRIELGLRRRAGKPEAHVRFDCARVTGAGGEPLLRVVLTDITQRRQAELNQRIAARALESRELERRQVARELHEDLGQRLTALKMNLATLAESSQAPEQADLLGEMMDTLDESVATVRRIAAEMRPLMLDDLGLNAALDWLVRDTAKRLGVQVRLVLDQDDPPLSDIRSIGLYRLLQDALAHLARQAPAADITVELRRRAGELLLTVQDTGSGWSMQVNGNGPRQTESLEGLQSQAQQLGGQFELTHVPSGGQRLRIRLPLNTVPTDPNNSHPRESP
jgi:PAS domain S-box-containing protein